VRVAVKDRLWQCIARYDSQHLYISRRSGAWRRISPQHATADALADL
jgi:hypothetical protein